MILLPWGPECISHLSQAQFLPETVTSVMSSSPETRWCRKQQFQRFEPSRRVFGYGHVWKQLLLRTLMKLQQNGSWWWLCKWVLLVTARYVISMHRRVEPVHFTGLFNGTFFKLSSLNSPGGSRNKPRWSLYPPLIFLLLNCFATRRRWGMKPVALWLVLFTWRNQSLNQNETVFT